MLSGVTRVTLAADLPPKNDGTGDGFAFVLVGHGSNVPGDGGWPCIPNPICIPVIRESSREWLTPK